MPYLFDTSAISEVLRVRPHAAFVAWVSAVPRQEQYTSSIVVSELYAGAYASNAQEKWLSRIEDDVLPRVTVLPFDLACARSYGRIRAHLRREGMPIGDTDTMIGAVALHFDLEVVTANVRHFERIPGIRVRPVR